MDDLESDVAAFATLAATLADPSVDRPSTLAAHGLDEAGWGALDDAWQARLSAEDDAADDDGDAPLPPLLVAYAEAFARAQRARAKALPGLDALIEVTRAMRRGADPKVVLARAGLSLESYLAAQRHWTEAMLRDEALAERFRRSLG